MYACEKDREKEREVDPFPTVFVEACISLFTANTGIGVPILFYARYSSTTVCTSKTKYEEEEDERRSCDISKWSIRQAK